ncbi:unnamed protein product [Arctogadus glacialis]
MCRCQVEGGTWKAEEMICHAGFPEAQLSGAKASETFSTRGTGTQRLKETVWKETAEWKVKLGRRRTSEEHRKQWVKATASIDYRCGPVHVT